VKIAHRAMLIIGWIALVIALVTVGWRAILTFDAGRPTRRGCRSTAALARL
jgi:hypothetical protein